jgi:hypothetical protein
MFQKWIESNIHVTGFGLLCRTMMRASKAKAKDAKELLQGEEEEVLHHQSGEENLKILPFKGCS